MRIGGSVISMMLRWEIESMIELLRSYEWELRDLVDVLSFILCYVSQEPKISPIVLQKSPVGLLEYGKVWCQERRDGRQRVWWSSSRLWALRIRREAMPIVLRWKEICMVELSWVSWVKNWCGWFKRNCCFSSKPFLGLCGWCGMKSWSVGYVRSGFLPMGVCTLQLNFLGHDFKVPLSRTMKIWLKMRFFAERRTRWSKMEFIRKLLWTFSYSTDTGSRLDDGGLAIPFLLYTSKQAWSGTESFDDFYMTMLTRPWFVHSWRILLTKNCWKTARENYQSRPNTVTTTR